MARAATAPPGKVLSFCRGGTEPRGCVVANLSHDRPPRHRLDLASARRHRTARSPMLPLPIRFIVGMLAYGLAERMARKAEYLREENRVIKEVLQAATGAAIRTVRRSFYLRVCD
jgi:hypothetical protein